MKPPLNRSGLRRGTQSKTHSDRLRNHYLASQYPPASYAQYYNCPIMVGIEEEVEVQGSSIILAPNPSNGQFRLISEKEFQYFEILDHFHANLKALSKR